jgi:hypothetical protein
MGAGFRAQSFITRQLFTGSAFPCPRLCSVEANFKIFLNILYVLWGEENIVNVIHYVIHNVTLV